jgi:hypothetical protein
LRSSRRSYRLRERLLQPGPNPRVIQSARSLGARLVESLRRVTVRSFASVAKPTAFPTRPTTPWTAVPMTAMVSSSRWQQVNPLSPRCPTRRLRAKRAWPFCSQCLRLMQKPVRKLVSLRSARSVIMTLGTVKTVNRKLGMATRDLV